MGLVQLHSAHVVTSDQRSIMSSPTSASTSSSTLSPRSSCLPPPGRVRTSSTPVQRLPGLRVQQADSPRAVAEPCAGVFESKEPPSYQEALGQLSHPLRARLATPRERASLPVFSANGLQAQASSKLAQTVSLVRLEPVIAAEPLPVQPEVVRDQQYVCNQISKAFVTTHSAAAWRNPLLESGGHTRLLNRCEGLWKMIDRLDEPGQKAHAYGQLVSQLVNYVAADGAPGFNKDRYGAARTAIEEVARKLHELQGDVTSVLIWSNVNRMVLELQGLSSGKAIIKSLVGANDALHQILQMSPKDADLHIKAVLAAQGHPRRQ